MSLGNASTEAAVHIGLRITHAQCEDLKQEAAQYGYDLSSLLRLRIFGKIKGLRVVRRPHPDIGLLGDILGKLTALTDELNKLAFHTDQIAGRLNQGSRDLFGLDGAQRQFGELSHTILHVLTQIEAAITGRLSTHNREENSL